MQLRSFDFILILTAWGHFWCKMPEKIPHLMFSMCGLEIKHYKRKYTNKNRTTKFVSVDSSQGTQGSIPDRGDGFFLCPLHPAGCGAHPASCTIGTGGFLPMGKIRPGRAADHSPSSSAKVKTERGYTSSPPQRLSWSVAGLVCVCVCVCMWFQSTSLSYMKKCLLFCEWSVEYHLICVLVPGCCSLFWGHVGFPRNIPRTSWTS
jgi:hypothetical protein